MVFIYNLSEKIKNHNYILTLAAILFFSNFIGNIKYNLLFASLVLFAYFLDNRIKYAYSKFYSKLGDLTYGSYLLHIPIQLLIILMFSKFSLDNALFTKYYFLITYILFVFFLSYISYKFYENPIRISLKKKFNKL